MTTPNQRPPETDLERALADDHGEFGAIYRRLPRAEPPRRLDRAILAEAARSVHGSGAPRAQRWLLGVGSAAGILLAAGIAWRVSQETNFGQPAPDNIDRAEGAATGVPIESIEKSETKALRADNNAALGVPANSVETPEGASKPTPAAEQASVGGHQSMQTKSESAAHERHAPSAGAAAPPPAPSRPLLSPAPPSESVVATPRPASEPEARARESRSPSTTTTAQPFPAQAVAPRTDAAAARHAETAAAKDAAKSVGKQGAESVKALSKDALSVPIADQSQRNRALSPAAWLREIARLDQAGQHTQAITNLRAFRVMYPDWKIPDSLRDLESLDPPPSDRPK